MEEQVKKKSSNPKRRCKRYCSGVNVKSDGTILKSNGRDLDALTKDDAGNIKRKPSSELTKLRKRAKELGMKKVNRKSLEQLRKEVPEMEKAVKVVAESNTVVTEKVTEQPPVATETVADTVEEEVTPKYDIVAMKAEIKAKGGKLPRGRKANDFESLQAILKELG